MLVINVHVEGILGIIGKRMEMGAPTDLGLFDDVISYRLPPASNGKYRT